MTQRSIPANDPPQPSLKEGERKGGRKERREKGGRSKGQEVWDME